MSQRNQPRLKLQHGPGSYRQVLLDLAGFDRRPAAKLYIHIQHKWIIFIDFSAILTAPARMTEKARRNSLPGPRQNPCVG